MKKIILVAIIFIFQSAIIYADGDIGYKGVYINKNGTKTWYKAHDVAWSYSGCGNFQFYGASDFDAQDFGVFTSSQSLEISGFAVVGWTDGSDWVAGRLKYRIWEQNDDEPTSWSIIDVGNYLNYYGSSQVVCTSGSDRIVGYDDGITNINPGAPGTYNIKIQAFGQMQWGSDGTGGFFNVLDGPEMTATFTITSSSTDNFRSKVAAGDWNTSTSWESSSNSINWAESTLVPGLSASSITIIDGHNVTLDADVTVSSLDINSGATFTASDASARTLTLTRSNSGNSTTLSNLGTWDNGVGGSTVIFSGAPSSGDAIHAVSGTIPFQNITVNKTGGSSNVGVSFGEGSSISGTLEIGSGGYISTAPPASFYGANAILKFNQGASAIYDVESGDFSWSTTEVPNYITIASGTVNLNAARSATGDLIIDGGVLAIKSDLTINGSFTNNANESNVIISSNESSTGSLITNGTVSGSITSQRYVSAYTGNDDGWHLISSPVNTPTISVSTNLAPGDNDDFYAWNEVAYEWTNYKPGTVFTTMTNGYGYLVSYEAADTKYFTGVPNTSAVTISDLSVTAGEGNGWHLVGNPFPSAIKWNNNNGSGTDYWTLTNIAGTAKRMNESGSYTDIGVDGIIPAMQGFFIQASTHQDNELVIPVEAKTHSTQSWAKNSVTEKITLVAHDLDQSMYQESVISINDKASNGFDFKYDSRFMAWYAPQFYSIVEQEKLSTNCYPLLNDEMVIPFGFIKNASSEFSIELSETIEGKTVYLTDLKTNTTQKLSENPIYTFTSEEGDDPDRFEIHFGVVGIDDQPTNASIQAYVYGQQLQVLGNGGITQLDIFDVQGRLLSSEIINVMGGYSKTLNLQAGMYVVRLQNKEGVSSTKVIIN